jgi:hypothetical protein
MSLRVAFDMDGTVADMYAALRREAETLFGADILRREPPATDVPEATAGSSSMLPPAVMADDLHLTRAQQAALWDRVRNIDNFWATLPEEEPGIIARIARTARARRWEVLFITTRPATAGEPTQLQTQRWLHAHGFEFPSVWVLQGSRGRLAESLQLDVVVDDRPENCLDVAVDSRAMPVLVWHGPLDQVPGGLKRMGVRSVRSITEALEWIEKLDGDRRQSALVRSIRRLFRREE